MIGDYSSGQIEYYDSLARTLIKAPKNLHNYGIISLKYLSYGFVASSSLDKTVNIWDPNTWSSIQVYNGHTDNVYGLDQIDDDTIVSGSWDKTIHIWKISTGENIRIIPIGQPVNSVRVLLNGFQIACGLLSFSGELRIYNYSSGNYSVQTLYTHTMMVWSIEVLNEQYIANGDANANVFIWDLETYSIKYKLKGHRDWVLCIKRISSNLLASGDRDGLIIIWNWLEGTLVHRLIGHTSELSGSSLDLYDDQTLISGSKDTTIKFWNILNGTLIETTNTGIQIKALTIFNKGKFLFFNLNFDHLLHFKLNRKLK